MSTSRIPSGSTVLVTGSTGLIGSATAQELLKRGYEVVGTTRDVSKTTDLVAKFDAAYGKGHFRPIAINNPTDVEAYRAALKGVAGVIHLATDSSFSTDPNVVVDGTIAATLAVLKAAAATPSVKSVVLTSSSVTVNQPEVGKTVYVDLKKYNESWVDLAYAPGDNPAKPLAVYAASKIKGEQAAWKFVADEKPGFAFNTVLPEMTLGEIVNPRPGVYSTASWLNDYFTSGGGFLVNMLGVPAWWYVSTGDAARVHVGALLNPSVNGERLWAAADAFDVNQVLAIFREAYPDRTFPADSEVPQAGLEHDNAKSLELLKALGRPGWDPLKVTVLENVKQAQ